MDKEESILIQRWLEDESFVNWVKRSNEKDIIKWEAYFNEHGDQWSSAKKAKLLLSGINFKKIESGSEKGKRSLDRLFNKMESSTTVIKSQSKKKMQNPKGVNLKRPWLVAASVFLGMVISSFVYFQFMHSTKINISTGYGEQDIVNLPDGSIVTLNSNSKLIYHSKFSRIVELEGEAFFEVKKKLETGENFQVITPDLSVTVLGTSFNVNARNDQTKVFLEEGKVKLKMEDLNEKQIEMVPGDELTYSKKNKKITEKRENVSALENAFWKEGTLMFNKTSLSQALFDIEDIYGIHFILESDEMKYEEITGGVPIRDLKSTLETLDKVYGLDIRAEGKRYFLSKREE